MRRTVTVVASCGKCAKASKSPGCWARFMSDDRSFIRLPPSRLAQLKRADAIVLEADVSDSARAIAATQKYAQYPEGTPGLETRLTPEMRQRVESLLSRNQLDPAPMMRMKPWMLANVLALFEAAQAGYVPAYRSRLTCCASPRPTASPFWNSKASSSSSSSSRRRHGRRRSRFSKRR